MIDGLFLCGSEKEKRWHNDLNTGIMWEEEYSNVIQQSDKQLR